MPEGGNDPRTQSISVFGNGRCLMRNGDIVRHPVFGNFGERGVGMYRKAIRAFFDTSKLSSESCFVLRAHRPAATLASVLSAGYEVPSRDQLCDRCVRSCQYVSDWLDKLVLTLFAELCDFVLSCADESDKSGILPGVRFPYGLPTPKPTSWVGFVLGWASCCCAPENERMTGNSSVTKS